MKRFLVSFLASCGFVGHIPFASGTFGTIPGIALVWLTYQAVDISAWNGRIIYAFITIALILVAIPISTYAERIYNKKDASQIVIDEAVSFFITMFWLPFTIKIIAVGFVLNRIADIIKPQPARICQERLPRGYGVVLDDMVSAVYSNIALRLIIFLTGNFFFS